MTEFFLYMLEKASMHYAHVRKKKDALMERDGTTLIQALIQDTCLNLLMNY